MKKNKEVMTRKGYKRKKEIKKNYSKKQKWGSYKGLE